MRQISVLIDFKGSGYATSWKRKSAGEHTENETDIQFTFFSPTKLSE